MDKLFDVEFVKNILFKSPDLLCFLIIAGDIES